VDDTSAFSCAIPDRLEALPELRSALRSWLADSGVEPDAAEDIVLAAWEVCANAIEHPVARSGPDTTIVATRQPLGVQVVVEDSGSWRHVRSPRSDRGLGLRLARAMVDCMSVVRDRPGTAVILWRSTKSAA
jgi:anti-sigma regulatory factor (Ser/Thr protein kinase)